MAGIDGPNDFIERLRQVAGPAKDAFKMVATGIRLGQVAQQRHLRQSGTNVIMDVAGNARPFPLNGMAAFLFLQLSSGAAFAGQINNEARPRDRHRHQPPPERAQFPKKFRHNHVRRGGFTQGTVPVTGPDQKLVMARRQPGIPDRPLRN